MMAIASLRSLVAQVPSWQNQLDKLVAEINARQIELSKIENENGTEPDATAQAPELSVQAVSSPRLQVVDNMNIDSATSALSQQQTTQSIGNGLASTKATKPEPVYFDGSMQKFFEELVHFIAVSRNMMRKAKMAARVAQIKKMAEIEIKDELADNISASERPALRYISPRRLDSGLGPATPNGGVVRPARSPDIFDSLDKNLDTLQSTSELAAFQFLREPSNNRHIKTMKKILADVLEAATAELDRLARDEPDMVKDADAVAARTKRPLSMRKELPAGVKPPDAPNKRQNTGGSGLAPSTSLPSIGHMEVDLAALRNDEPIAPQVIHLPANVPA